MRKKLLPMFFTMFLSVHLCACGESNDSVVYNDNANLAKVNTEVEDTYLDDELSTGTTPDYEEELDTTIGAEDADIEDLTAEDEISGLIVMTADVYRIDISSLDPETGESHSISSFAIKPPENTRYAVHSEMAWYGNMHGNRIFANDGYARDRGLCLYSTHKECFNDDYSGMSLTKRFDSNEETHAGWVDNDGNFFDVTEALGLSSQGDFSDPVHYRSIGFSEDGYFAYVNLDEYYESYTDGYYYVPVSDISEDAIMKGSPFPNGESEDKPDVYNSVYDDITDWIDDHTCLKSYEGYENYKPSGKWYVEVFDLETDEYTKFIPESSRSNWNGVLSPDNTMVAFMSEPMSGNEGSDVFMVPLSGGEPTRIENDITFANRISSENSGHSWLIDWR